MQKINVCIWGAGHKLEETYNSLRFDRCELLFIVDSLAEKNNTKFNGVNIVNPNNVDFNLVDYIVISAVKSEAIVEECNRRKIPSQKVIAFWNDTLEYDFIINTIKENIRLGEGK